MIAFSRIERRQRVQFCHDPLWKHAGLIKLGNIAGRDMPLRRGGRKDRRAVLRPSVRPLPVELGRIVHDREKDLQNRP